MSRTYLLVDFENVQPALLGTHLPPEAETSFVKVFAGAHQSKVDLSLARALQVFGPRAEYIQIVGSGKDALDFHIAYYIGRLSAEHPGSAFIILSKDTGFDPLIKHLALQNVSCTRVRSLTEVPPAKRTRGGKAIASPGKKVATKSAAKSATANATPLPSPAPAPRPRPSAAKTAATVPPLPTGRLQEIVKRLVGLKGARPGTVKTLRSSVMAWFKPALTEAQMDGVLAQLQAQGLLRVTGSKVAYVLPPPK